MQLKFFLAVCFAVALTGTECRHLPEDQPPVARNSTPCSLQPARICSSLQDTDNYSLQLDIHSSSSDGYIKVKVHSTRCVLKGGPLPWWYQVELVATEASSGDSEEHSDTSRAGGQCLAGRFQVAKRKQEMSLCEVDSKVVFSSCSPSLLDLPRLLSFHPHSQCTENDTLCFRLTLQEGGERACLQKQVCLQLPTWPPRQTPSSNGNAVVGNSRSVSHSNSLLEVVYPPGIVHVGSGFGEGSGDGSNYVDLERDEEMIQKIINDMIQMGGKVEEIPSNKGCHKAKAVYTSYNLPWVPDCDCEGYYKDVQCAEANNEMKCWCSTPSGSEVYNSRKTIRCSDPQSLEFQC